MLSIREGKGRCGAGVWSVHSSSSLHFHQGTHLRLLGQAWPMVGPLKTAWGSMGQPWSHLTESLQPLSTPGWGHLVFFLFFYIWSIFGIKSSVAVLFHFWKKAEMPLLLYYSVTLAGIICGTAFAKFFLLLASLFFLKSDFFLWMKSQMKWWAFQCQCWKGRIIPYRKHTGYGICVVFLHGVPRKSCFLRRLTRMSFEILEYTAGISLLYCLLCFVSSWNLKSLWRKGKKWWCKSPNWTATLPHTSYA